STRSRESAFKSSTNAAVGSTWSSSTPSCSTIIFCTLVKVSSAIMSPLRMLGRKVTAHCGRTARAASALDLLLPASHDSSEDAVDESAGVFAPEGFRDLHGFIDRRLHRHALI